MNNFMEKTASVLKRAKEEILMEKKAREEAEKKLESYKNHQERLYKLASKETIQFEDVPGLLDTLAEMDEEQQNLELRSLEKAANMDFLKMGHVGKLSNSNNSSDALTNFILNN